MDVELAWKREVARPHPFGAWAAIPLLVVALTAMASWWLAAHVWLVAFRPALVGVDSSSDSGPMPGVLLVCAFLAAMGVGLATLLTVAPGCSPSARRIAASIIAVGLALGCAAVLAASSGGRCSVDGYAGTTTCVSQQTAVTIDLVRILVPGALAIACLVVGARLERRKVGLSGPEASGGEPPDRVRTSLTQDPDGTGQRVNRRAGRTSRDETLLPRSARR